MCLSTISLTTYNIEVVNILKRVAKDSSPRRMYSYYAVQRPFIISSIVWVDFNIIEPDDNASM